MFRIKATSGQHKGKYSLGGTVPRFTKGGSTWNTIGVLQEHLDELGKAGHDEYNRGHAVIEEITNSATYTRPLTTRVEHTHNQ